MTNFDVEMIIIDNAGYQFIDSCNENKEFIKKFMTRDGQSIFKPSHAKDIFEKDDFIKN